MTKQVEKAGINTGKEKWASLDEIIAAMWREPGIEKVGGLFTFSANVKDTSMARVKQTGLSVDVQDKAVALQRMKEIIRDTEKDPLVHKAALHMNDGVLHPRDDIIHLAIAGVQDAPEVRKVFSILHEMLNRLKRETQTRFKEITTEGAAYYKPKDPTKTFD